MKQDIDKLLRLYFHRQPDFSRLDGMEHMLWEKIEASNNRLWFEHLLEVLSWPRFQLTALVFSLLVGFSAGLTVPRMTPPALGINSFEKSMSIFAINSLFLPSTALSGDN